jgi:hypothetical protein
MPDLTFDPMLDLRCPDTTAAADYEALAGKGYFGEMTVAALAVEPLADFLARVRRICKGNAVREARHGAEAGIDVRQFHHASWLADIAEINHSMPVRSGGPMLESYMWTADERGYDPSAPKIEPAPPVCPLHHKTSWGAFADGKLIAYITLGRIGELAYYSQIMGHGDWLARHVMMRLHFEMVRHLAEDAMFAGVKVVFYGSWQEDSRKLWKQRAGFGPATLRRTG